MHIQPRHIFSPGRPQIDMLRLNRPVATVRKDKGKTGEREEAQNTKFSSHRAKYKRQRPAARLKSLRLELDPSPDNP